MIQTYKDRILVETEYDGANVSCIRTQKGLVLVDSPFLPGDAREWAGLIRERTGRDVAFQINTDHHFDHVMGNEFLTDNIICHNTAVRGIRYIRNKQVLKDIIGRCRELKLRVAGRPEQLKIDAAIMLTVNTMNFVYSGRRWVDL